MLSFFSKHARQLRNLTLVMIMVIPFFLYWAAMHDLTGLVYVLLTAMGLSMLLALKVG